MNDRNQALHPNLARLAAAYDEIFQNYQANRLTSEQARQAVLELVDRDDQGVRWRINPANGAWYRETLDGQWVPDTPPRFGVATVAAADISPGGTGHAAHNVLRSQVDPRVLTPPAEGGVLWRTDQAAATSGKRGLPGPLKDLSEKRPVVLIAGIVVLLVVVLFMFNSRDAGVTDDGVRVDPQTGQPLVVDNQPEEPVGDPEGP